MGTEVGIVIAAVVFWAIGTIIAYKTMNSRKASQIEASKSDIEQTRREYMRATGSQNELPARSSAYADSKGTADDIRRVRRRAKRQALKKRKREAAALARANNAGDDGFVSYEVDTNEVADNDAWADAPYARAKTTKPASAPAAAAELLLEDAIVLDLVLGPPRAVHALSPQPWRR